MSAASVIAEASPTHCSPVRLASSSRWICRLSSATGHEWKVDVSIWTNGVPVEVEPFQRSLEERLSAELRLVLLRLKEAWWRDPAYPDLVGGFEIYDAVLEHGVRTLEELDAYLRERGLPVRS